ncbi:usg protein [Sphingomonas sp. KRR8]|uniref:usg protein n=1 Tax=Sphingomonas sp. KRR8 TaxID=2942996 RepID=UPI0020208FB0|nr:usg protein [Sphingomonas sp. KRR8]URD59678.1 usg protein [Sphingomonas sp. KRR8]
MRKGLVTPDLELQLQGYGLSLVEVHYFMPDHPSLLQLFSFQQYDIAPKYPALSHFLDHWRREIEATIHSIRMNHQALVGASEWRNVDTEWLIN